MIQDSNFNPNDWAVATFVHGGSGTATVGQLADGGNPGGWRVIDHGLIGTQATLYSFHQFTHSIYSPAASGAVATIDYSEDAQGVGHSGGTGGFSQLTGISVLQNGKLFLALNNGSALTPNSVGAWNSITFSGLVAGDFSEYSTNSGSINFSSHPEFQSFGAPITFGFFRANGAGGSPSFSISGGIDNWKVTVRGTEPTRECTSASIRLSEAEVCWPSIPNAVYEVEYRPIVDSTNWFSLLNNLVGTGQTLCIYDKIAGGEQQRLYRIVCTGHLLGVTNLIAVNPRATYLNADREAEDAIPIELAGLNIHPGDKLLLRQFGSFQFSNQSTEQLKAMIGVFSTSPTLLARGTIQRVAGAISTGMTFTTALVDGNVVTDIPEDFLINESIISVPPGATHLFLSGHDVHYGDNSDPDGDYHLEILQFSP